MKSIHNPKQHTIVYGRRYLGVSNRWLLCNVVLLLLLIVLSCLTCCSAGPLHVGFSIATGIVAICSSVALGPYLYSEVATTELESQSGSIATRGRLGADQSPTDSESTSNQENQGHPKKEAVRDGKIRSRDFRGDWGN